MNDLVLVILTVGTVGALNAWALCVLAACPRLAGRRGGLVDRGVRLGGILQAYVPALVMAFVVLVSIQTGWHWPLAGLLLLVLLLWVFAQFTGIFDDQATQLGGQDGHGKKEGQDRAAAAQEAVRRRSCGADGPNG